MATPTINNDLTGDRSVVLIEWALTTADPNGDGAPWCDYSDRTFTVVGSTWSTAVCAIEGSNDGTNWMTLSDAAGAADATATAANKAMTVVELTRFVRPRLTTIGSGAVINVSLLARRATPLRT